MPYKMKTPDPDSLIAESTELGARLYAQLADVPLYVNMQLIAPGYVGKRQSFRLGWVISSGRLANSRDRFIVPDELLAWVTAEVSNLYPDHATATGLSADEVAELEAEQKTKRAKYEK